MFLFTANRIAISHRGPKIYYELIQTNVILPAKPCVLPIYELYRLRLRKTKTLTTECYLLDFTC